MQSELLSVIQEGTYKPVGSDRWEQTDFRLVCATNRDLQTMQAGGTFRTDLYHRIAAAQVRLPSLESRATDIPALARHFLHAESGDPLLELTPDVEAYLVRRHYPGNVRDLKQLVARTPASPSMLPWTPARGTSPRPPAGCRSPTVRSSSDEREGRGCVDPGPPHPSRWKRPSACRPSFSRPPAPEPRTMTQDG